MGNQGTGLVLTGTLGRRERDNGEKMEGAARMAEVGRRFRKLAPRDEKQVDKDHDKDDRTQELDGHGSCPDPAHDTPAVLVVPGLPVKECGEIGRGSCTVERRRNLRRQGTASAFKSKKPKPCFKTSN